MLPIQGASIPNIIWHGGIVRDSHFLHLVGLIQQGRGASLIAKKGGE